MCGIFGCISHQPQNLIKDTLSGLKILEYRGYDSAGITYSTAAKDKTIKSLTVIKSTGDIGQLATKIKDYPKTTTCIGHTRWATNGTVCAENSHPHMSFNNKIAVVHNGIIENYQECSNYLLKNGIKLKTPVDTEVIPNILYILHNNKHNIHNYLQGQYAFCAIQEDGNSLFLAKKGTPPLYIGRNQHSIYITSDTLALPASITDIISLENLDTCEISNGKIVFYNQSKLIKKDWTPFQQSFIATDKNGFSTYMEKEINEIPSIMQKIFHDYTTNKRINLLRTKFRNLLSNIDCVHICGCGTSFHAALILSKIFEKELHIRTIAHISSELTSHTLLKEKSIAIVISQSGETADTLACMDILHKHKIPIIALCNVPTSTIAQSSKITFPLLCGPEIAVASTKVFCAAVLVGCLIITDYDQDCQNQFLSNTQQTLHNARKILPTPETRPIKIFIVGKGIAYALALEGALKIKEVTYLHCEGYPAHELKHGPLSMIDNKTLAITIGDDTDNAKAEIEARGGKVIQIAKCDNNPLSFIYQIIPLQIFALDLAQSLNINPDKPRNLAKSVTVL